MRKRFNENGLTKRGCNPYNSSNKNIINLKKEVTPHEKQKQLLR